MKRCPCCGSLRLLSALDGTTAFCARCHSRLSGAFVRPLFTATPVTELMRGAKPDPTPAA